MVVGNDGYGYYTLDYTMASWLCRYGTLETLFVLCIYALFSYAYSSNACIAYSLLFT